MNDLKESLEKEGGEVKLDGILLDSIQSLVVQSWLEGSEVEVRGMISHPVTHGILARDLEQDVLSCFTEELRRRRFSQYNNMIKYLDQRDMKMVR